MEDANKPRYALVLERDLDAPSTWKGRAVLPVCGPDPVQFDGRIIPIPRKKGDAVCRRVTAVNVQTNEKFPAAIIALSPRGSRDPLLGEDLR